MTGVTVLARAPVAGSVKTRLAASWGAGRAAELHEAMTLDVLEDLAARHEGPLVLALTGDAAACAAVARAACDLVPRLRVEPQPEGDLGRRMLGVLRARLEEGAGASLVVGTDCLEVASCLPRAAAALVEADAVLVPARDGGFVLLGLRRALPEDGLDGVAWGTPRALAETVGALRRAGAAVVAEGAALDDVDDEEGLRRLVARLAEPDAPRAPRVRRLTS